MASEQENRAAFDVQKHWCGKMDAPIYATICGALASGLTRESGTGARVLDWAGEPTRDALPLRLMGGLHALVRAGADAELAGVFAGYLGDIGAVLARVLVRHDAALSPWLDGPPQTNEPGRSAALMTGLLEVARRVGGMLELLEIGSSGGLNLLIDRYRFDLGGASVGPEGSPVTIAPEWLGEPPIVPPIEIVGVRGCDMRPLDVTDPAIEARLAAYVWAEKPERLARLQTAIGMVRERGVRLEQADAADWVEARLAEPQDAGVCRVLMHSVVWQYLPEPTAQRIRAAMAAAGARATAERPIAWVVMEPDRAIGEMMVSVRSWPDRDV
ncbi:DUF2332 domain-containing protein [uncultured Sphingomonas sp.]|uniref:DUF2332 domain-containing protein n=1 Tax=uncultured Sphingomonas sp. TaxID=158754 RepID=UPI0035C9802F